MINTLGGYTCLLRSRLDDPWLRDPTIPAHRALAYWWLHRSAAWRPESRIVNGREILLQRGQLLISYSALATEWKWNIPAVQRFLAKCSQKEWLGTHVAHGRLVITLLDYDAWRQAETAGDMAADMEHHIARDAGDTPPDTAGASRRPRKFAETAKPLRNDDTADDTAFSARYRNHDMGTDKYKKKQKKADSSNSRVDAHANGRAPGHLQQVVGERVVVALKSAAEQPMVDRIIAVFDDMLVEIFGPGQGTGHSPAHGNHRTAHEMWCVAERAGLSEEECCEIARAMFGDVLIGLSERAGPHDHTRGRIESLRFFHGDKSVRWGRAIDAHLHLQRRETDSHVPARGAPSPSRPAPRKPGRENPFAGLAARVEQRRTAKSGVVIDDVAYREISK